MSQDRKYHDFILLNVVHAAHQAEVNMVSHSWNDLLLFQRSCELGNMQCMPVLL